MTFSTFKPGNFAEGERLESDAHMNYINESLPNCVDGGAGGTYTPSATLSIASLHCPTTPATGNAVANKTYVDTREAAITAYIDGEISTIESDTPSTIYTSSTHSNLTNISAVSSSTDAIIVIRRGNYVTAHAYFNVTNSVSGEKSFEFTLPYTLGNFAQQYHLTGSGCVYNAAGNYPAMVYAVTGSQRAKCEWYSTDVAGSVPVRLSFGYYIGVP